MDGNTGMEGWSGKQRILRREEAGGERASQEARLAEALAAAVCGSEGQPQGVVPWICYRIAVVVSCGVNVTGWGRWAAAGVVWFKFGPLQCLQCFAPPKG